MTDYPDDIALIIARRQEGAQEKDIAAELGISSKTLWSRVSTWNIKNPDNRIPRPACRPETPFYVQVAKLWKEGKTVKEIAAAIGKSPSRTEQLLAVARDHRLIPFKRRSTQHRGGIYTLTYYKNKGALPIRGHVSEVFALLTADQVLQVIEQTGPKEKLSSTLARIVKEHLDAQQAPQ